MTGAVGCMKLSKQEIAQVESEATGRLFGGLAILALYWPVSFWMLENAPAPSATMADLAWILGSLAMTMVVLFEASVLLETGFTSEAYLDQLMED